MSPNRGYFSAFCNFCGKNRTKKQFISLTFVCFSASLLFTSIWTLKLNNPNNNVLSIEKLFLSIKRLNVINFNYENFTFSSENIKTQQWMTVPNGQEDDWSLSVYDSFYDYRINKTVVFVASQVAENLERQGHIEIPYKYYCIYFDTGATYLRTVLANFYTGYMLYCDKIDSGTIPTYVTIVRNDSIAMPNWLSPVRHMTPTVTNSAVYEPKNFALCVGIIFANQPWLTLVQFFEFHRMQGVEKFYVFYYDLKNPTTRNIFAYYMKNWPDLIELIEWSPKTKFCTHYWCQLLRDNYCLYANVNKFRYLGFIDIDELLYPVDDKSTVLQMLRNVDRSYIGSFTFRVKWYQTLRDDSPFWARLDRRDLRGVVKKYLPLLHYNNVSTLANELYSPKTVVKPERVLRKWIHFVREHTPGSFYYFMNETQAYLVHFKIRTWWGIFAEQAEQIVNFTIVDPYETFGVQLISTLVDRVVDVVENVKLNF